MDLVLQRITPGASDATLGVIVYEGFPRWFTLEPPWKDNAPRVSSIPQGRYVAKRRFDSSKAPITWELEVPGRSHILCGHVGNSVSDTEGCVLFGNRFGYQNGKLWVFNSALAYSDFVSTLHAYEHFTLEVKDL